MDNLIWIILGSLMMSAIALVGGISILLKPVTLDKLLLPFISLAAGTLLGGAFFHMMPQGIAILTPVTAAIYLVSGFSIFLGLEQLLHWHQTHRGQNESPKPVTYLILIGDAIHNFIGGLSIASTFLINPQAGIVAFIAAAAHEVPQEIGDFGILIRGGFRKRQALLWNFISALTFPLGAVLAYFVSQQFEVAGLMLFGAGNFIYIAAADLVPEIKSQSSLLNVLLNFIFFATGVLITLLLA